jgi:glycosyltransferase involved in cell wall biosynthesis
MNDDKIKVMFVIGSMGNARAGTEKNLLTIISSLNRDRFTPYLVSLQDCDYIRAGNFACDTSCLNVYQMFSPAMRRARRELAERVQTPGIDIVQTFFTEAHMLGGAAARLGGAKAVISSRRNLGYSYGFKEKLYLRIANRYPTRWLANCKAVADEIAVTERLDRFRFDVIYNGVALHHESSENAFGTVGDVSSDVVMVANLRPIKSVDTLIRAAALVIKSRPDTRFVILGDGPQRGELTRLTDELNVSSNVRLAGSVDDIMPYLTSSRIAVLTSLSEGCSNAILEYMNASLPVVASNVGGNPELVVDDETGYLVQPRDAQAFAEKIIHLLEHPDDSATMGRAGRLRAERQFSVARMISDYEAYYEKLLQPQR